MKLNKNEQTLYDFFVSIGEPASHSIEYPLLLLGAWDHDDDEHNVVDYDRKQEVIEAYRDCLLRKGSLDKALYLAIKKIKGWK